MNLLSELALRFSPAEYLALGLLVCFIPVVFTRQTMLRALGASVCGLMLGLIGTDINSGINRFTGDLTELADGVPIQCFVLGLVLIPWAVRSHADEWIPFAKYWQKQTLVSQRLLLRIWRFIVIFWIVDACLETYDSLNMLGIYFSAVLGIVGCVFHRVGIPWLPACVSFVQAVPFEENLRRTLLLAKGNFFDAINRPIALTLLLLVVVAFLVRTLLQIKRKKQYLPPSIGE